ncbi:MAG: hypothetical protein CM15mV15_1390 [uncultured marine virus]|nr:MAG: hypothetical protein CM15mV15_1390 [uncultured marine virus]
MDKISAALGTINSALGASGSNLDANSVGALVKKKYLTHTKKQHFVVQTIAHIIFLFNANHVTNKNLMSYIKY